MNWQRKKEFSFSVVGKYLVYYKKELRAFGLIYSKFKKMFDFIRIINTF